MYRILFAILLISSQVNAGNPMEIIELKSRPVEEIIPLIQPLLEPGSSISGMNNQLIIRATPEQISEVKKILERFDRPARRLIIHVRHGSVYDINRDGVRADINRKLGRHTRIATGERTPPGTARLTTKSASTRSKLDSTQHVQALEGKPAFIATGKAVPINEQTTYFSGGAIAQTNTIRYRNVTTGFYVIPRVNGNRVTISISPQMQRQGQIHGTYDISAAHTTVSGNIGEWITVGGASAGTEQNHSEILKRSSTSSHDQRSIQLLVQEIH